MPNPADYEDKDEFMSECISTVEGEGKPHDQAVAQCNSMWERKDALLFFGGQVKALGNGKLGGHLVRFTNPDEVDLEGEYFDASTDFGTAKETDTYYSHGLDVKLGKRVLGRGMLGQDDLGIWIETQLKLRDEYEQAIYSLAEQGKLGWSSGTAGHLVEREEKGNGAVHITRWPLGLDASLTPTPADPGNRALPLKEWAASAKGLQIAPQAEGNSAATITVPEGMTATITVTNQKAQETPTSTEVLEMSEEKQEAPPQEVVTTKQLDAAIEGVQGMITEMSTNTSKQLSALLQKLEKSGPLKDGGYVAPDSEKDHPETKSFGDFLLAIYRGNKQRLNSVYAPTPAQVKALGEQSGTAGGYLVPTDYEARLMAMAQEAAVVRPRATVIPVRTNQGEIPALDQSTAPTAGVGHSAFAGGVVAAWTPEAGSLSSTDPVFTMVQWNINKMAGYTKVSNELIADSAIALDSLLSKLFGMAVAAMEDYTFIRGTGAGEPLGILAAPCTIAITTTTNTQFAMADALKMLARFWPTPGSTSVVWLLNRGLIPDLYAYFPVTTGGTDLVQPREQVPNSILGYPIVYSEHMPAADSDDAILADLSAYVIFDRQGMQIAYSEHSAFTTDEGTWRFTKRLDGKPWLKEAITLADPGGATTVSPFLYHDD